MLEKNCLLYQKTDIVHFSENIEEIWKITGKPKCR